MLPRPIKAIVTKKVFVVGVKIIKTTNEPEKKSPEIDPHIHGKLIFAKSVIVT